MVGKIRTYDYKGSTARINDLLKNLNLEDDIELVTRMKEIVPEFLSENSIYEALDEKNETVTSIGNPDVLPEVNFSLS